MTRFDRFMEVALYHPQKGYYSSRISSVGPRGDFTTTPQLSSTLAKAIAHHFNQSGFHHLIEVGPGTGTLTRAIWRELSFLKRRKTKLHLVEVSIPLQKLQKQALPQAFTHSTIQSALEAASEPAFVYSNELVDAFPVRIFRKEEQEWSELFLTGSQPQLSEQFQPLQEQPSSSLFEENYPKGHRIEIHESYRHWLAKWTSHFQGQLLTIDYVATAPRPRSGTLRGYFQHERLTGSSLYQNAGHTDLTADVHFKDLILWGKEFGLETHFHKSQREFLLPFTQNTKADHYLTDLEGAGSAFEVLLQEKQSTFDLNKS